MSNNPKINPIQAESIMSSKSPKSTSISTDGRTFTPSKSSVAKAGDVTLKSTTGSNVDIYTNVGGVVTKVFVEGSPPYPATTAGAKYTLDPAITGDVGLDVTATPSLGGNGTINVGG